MADEGLPPLPEPMEEERKMTKAEEAEAKKVRHLLVAFEIDDSLFPGSRACLSNPPAPMADQPNWACTCMRRGCEVECWLLGGTCPSFESREKKTAVKLSMSNT